MFMIRTNVHGVLVGGYYGEGVDSLDEAGAILEHVLKGDPKAEIVEVKKVIKKEDLQ